jgi:Flp pilus assembly protein TadD
MEALVSEREHDATSVESRAQVHDADPAIRYRDQAIRLSLQGYFAESESFSRQALRLRPDDVDILNELGVALWRQGKSVEAEVIYLRASQIEPNDFRVLTNLGLALYSLGRLEEAGAVFRKALTIRPDTFDAAMNLGIVLSDQGNFDEASVWLDRALELRPDSADALQNIGMNLGCQGKWHEAITFYDAALRLKPEFPEVHRNLAYALLCCGDYERAWPEHEWRLKCKPSEGHRINRTFWNGDDFRGQSLLVHAEQGFGDTLQFIRYASMVKRRGGQVMLLCHARLLRLLARCEGVDLAFDATSYVPDCHLHVPMLSLPAIFHTTLETVPAPVPYLRTDSVLVEHWRSVFAAAIDAEAARTISDSSSGGPAKPFVIGVAWQGNPARRMDNWRSFPLAQLAPLAAIPGVRLVSLQVEHGLDQLDESDRGFPVLDVLGKRNRDFVETAALMTHLDLVITPDTAVAHLAGGLGLRTWVALCSVGDWRYPHGRNETPWYPTMRLFRQSKLGEWDGVFGRMKSALEELLERTVEPSSISMS